jgi:hypothetical protein
MTNHAGARGRWHRRLAIVALFALSCSTAFAAPTDRVRDYRAARDAEVARLWKERDVDGVVAAVDDIFLRLPGDPLGRLWLAAAVAELGMPETGERLGRDALAENADSAAAQAFTEATGTLRAITISVGFDGDGALPPTARAALATGVARWAKAWTETPERTPPSAGQRPALARALALVEALPGGTPAGRASVDVDLAGPAARIVVRCSTARAIPDLDVTLVPDREPLHVDGAAMTMATTAPLVVRLRDLRTVVEEQLVQRLQAGDAAGLLAAFEERSNKLGSANTRQAWLAAVFALLRMPETAQALLKPLPTTNDAAWAKPATAVRGMLADALATTELTLEPEAGVPLSVSSRASLERGVGLWLDGWTKQPEKTGVQAAVAVEARARALLPRGFVASPAVDVAWQPGGLVVRVVGNRNRRPPALDLPAAPPLGRVFASAQSIAGRSSRIIVGPQFIVAFAALEPDEKITIDDRVIDISAEGRTAPLPLPRRVVVHRTLGALERHDELTLDGAAATVSLPRWDLLERAERLLGAASTTSAFNGETLAVLNELCAVDAGARGRRLLSSALDRPGATITVRGIDAGVGVDVGGQPTRAFACRGRTLLALPPGNDAVVVSVAPGRSVTVDAAARARGPLDLSSSVQLQATEPGTRWRIVGGTTWTDAASPVPVPLDRDRVDVDIAVPRHAARRMTVQAALGEHRVEPVSADTSAVREDWQRWETAQADRQQGVWLLAVPPALGAVAGGSAFVGWLYANGATNALATYNTTPNVGVAREQKIIVEQKGLLANVFAGLGIGVGALAVLSIGAPGAWFLVLHPDDPAPPEFDDGIARSDGKRSTVATQQGESP